jgi:hypothetical protein
LSESIIRNGIRGAYWTALGATRTAEASVRFIALDNAFMREMEKEIAKGKPYKK